MSKRIISSDSHVIEPPDFWTSRIGKQFGDRTPHMVTDEDGDWWYIDGHRSESFGDVANAGERFEHMEEVTFAGRFANVRPGAYIPEDFIKDLDLDGIYGAVIYPSAGLTSYPVSGADLLSAICSSYNDWLAEFCQTDSKRLKGVAMLNLDDIQEGINELKRSRKMGLAGAMIPVYPPEGRSYNTPEYEPFWATAQDLQMPLGLHITTNRLGRTGVGFTTLGATPTDFSVVDYWVRSSLADIIFSGVFERFPSLMIGSVEHELGWAPHFVEILDYTYTQRTSQYTERTLKEGWTRFKGSVLPSDYFRSNIFLGFQEDARGIRERAVIGVDSLMWGSDYPHSESTFPRSMEFLDRILKDVPQKEQEEILGGNAARVYQFD